MRALEAKNFLVEQTAEQAALENVPLSDLEKRMMYFTETGECPEDPIALNDAFEAEYDTSTIAQWDKAAHRWLMAQNVFSAPYMTCVAVSATPDATGTFFRYAFPQSNGFPDYPKWGIWTDAYYQHNNVFGGPNGFGSEPCAYERASMLKGNPKAKQICFFAPTFFDDSMLPADIDSAGTLPPAGQPELFLGSIDNTPPTSNVIYAYLFHVDFAQPSRSTFSGFRGTMPIRVPTFTLSKAVNCTQSNRFATDSNHSPLPPALRPVFPFCCLQEALG